VQEKIRYRVRTERAATRKASDLIDTIQSAEKDHLSGQSVEQSISSNKALLVS